MVPFSLYQRDQRGVTPADCWNEVNVDSKKQMIGILPWLVLDSSCWYKRFLSCLGCSSQPSTKYYFPHRRLFHFINPPSPSNLGRQACWFACLCVSGYTLY